MLKNPEIDCDDRPNVAWALEQIREVELAKKTWLMTGLRPVFAIGYLLCVNTETILKSFFQLKRRRMPENLSGSFKGLRKLGITLPWTEDQHEHQVAIINSLREVSVHGKMLSMQQKHETRSAFFHRFYPARVRRAQAINIFLLRQVCLSMQIYQSMFPAQEKDELYDIDLSLNLQPIAPFHIKPGSIWPSSVMDLSVFEFSFLELTALRHHNYISCQKHSEECLPLCEISSLFFCLEYAGDILSRRDATQRYSFECLLENITNVLSLQIDRRALQKIASFRRAFTHSDFYQMKYLFPQIKHLKFPRRNRIAYEEIFETSYRILRKAKEALSIKGFFHAPPGFELEELKRNPVFAGRVAREGSRYLQRKYTVRPSGLFVPASN